MRVLVGVLRGSVCIGERRWGDFRLILRIRERGNEEGSHPLWPDVLLYMANPKQHAGWSLYYELQHARGLPYWKVVAIVYQGRVLSVKYLEDRPIRIQMGQV